MTNAEPIDESLFWRGRCGLDRLDRTGPMLQLGFDQRTKPRLAQPEPHSIPDQPFHELHGITA